MPKTTQEEIDNTRELTDGILQKMEDQGITSFFDLVPKEEMKELQRRMTVKKGFKPNLRPLFLQMKNDLI